MHGEVLGVGEASTMLSLLDFRHTELPVLSVYQSIWLNWSVWNFEDLSVLVVMVTAQSTP